ncbi:E3 ubiquitin/ISG15 ligase TRIM25-like [Mixophyes fleayi]|uniref:E3 ubiquitin/ISG15 ligase TRIM25-like n=1 Tax=Mixophyes fleayi TaxID=3061075 RepID=UPI003F4D7908
MALTGLRDELICSICLSTYTDPVTLRCGHNFCWVCITQVLDNTGLQGPYTCPACRKRFSERPALHKNTTLCNIVQHLQPVPSERMMGVIFCTYCIEVLVPAAKSCLLCEASLCSDHLSVHNKSREHVLTEPTMFSKNSRCSLHRKVLDYFCFKDSTCVYCQTVAHRKDQAGQQTYPIDKESLKNDLVELTSQREGIVDSIHRLQLHTMEVQKNAADYLAQTTAIFVDINKQLQMLEKRILNEILRQEEQVLLSTSNMTVQLMLKKSALSQQISKKQALYNVVSTMHLSQVSKPESTELADEEKEEAESGLETWDEKFRAVGDLVGVLISETLHRDLIDIVTNVNPLFHGQEAADVLLDADTAGWDVVVSADKRTASCSRLKRQRPKNTEHLQYFNQVVSASSFPPGRYYWEVETGKTGSWRIGVAYPSAGREILKSRIGDNDKSWCLCKAVNQYSVIHDSRKNVLSKNVLCSKLGIYLNIWAGTLSFYELGDPIEHLYTFSTTFTEPLIVALCVGIRGRMTIKSKRFQSL